MLFAMTREFLPIMLQRMSLKVAQLGPPAMSAFAPLSGGGRDADAIKSPSLTGKSHNFVIPRV
jgi:hypothetical protein